MLSVFWSDEAKLDYWNNIDYLLHKWTVKEAQQFIQKVSKTIELIQPETIVFTPTHYKKVNKVIVTKQISLFYRINSDNQIELLRFWNNYQNPEKLKL